MYNFFAILIGSLIALMVTLNGTLFSMTNLYTSLLIIHFVGVVFSLTFLKLNKVKTKQTKKLPLYLYSGGLIGIVIVGSNNVSFEALGISFTTAVCLLGQSIASSIIDNYGLLNMPKIPFNKSKIPGFILVLGGIFIFFKTSKASINSFSPIFIIFMIAISLVSGAFVILSMIINSKLGEHIGGMHSTLINYITGFSGSLLLFIFIIIPKNLSTINFFKLSSIPWWAFLGGALGVIIVNIANIVIPKIPAVYSTLLIFIGQLFTGIVIEIYSDNVFSTSKLLGGLLISLGMLYNLYIDKKHTRLRTPKKV